MLRGAPQSPWASATENKSADAAAKCIFTDSLLIMLQEKTSMVSFVSSKQRTGKIRARAAATLRAYIQVCEASAAEFIYAAKNEALSYD